MIVVFAFLKSIEKPYVVLAFGSERPLYPRDLAGHEANAAITMLMDYLQECFEGLPKLMFCKWESSTVFS